MSIPTENNAKAFSEGRSAPDPLLSVVEVARLMGVGMPTAVRYVLGMGLRSLDEGELIKVERLDLPLIRRSELDRFAEELEAELPPVPASQTPANLVENEAFLAAYHFVMSLQEGNLEGVWNTSSRASKEALESPKNLARWWGQYLDIASASEPGVASGVYSIDDKTVAIKYMADTPASGGYMKVGTIVEAIPLALVHDPEGWRLDQPTQDRCAEWRHIVGGPQPEGGSGSANGPN
jgi:hypothetical protein